MALSVKVGYVDLSAATGSQAFTGVGFLPKCLLLFNSALSTASAFATEAANMYTMVGLGVSSTERAVAGGSAENGVGAANADSYRWLFTDRVLHQTQPNATGTVLWNVGMVSLDADGFTLTKTTAVANRTLYMAFGGTSLTNVKVGGGTVTSGTGAISFTGVGFRPDLLIFLVKPTSGNGDHENAQMAMGWANGLTQAGWSCFYDDESSPTNSVGVLLPDTAVITTSAAGISNSAQLSTMDSDGFTLNRLVSSGVNYAMAYMAFKFSDIVTKIGVETQGTSTGTKATTGLSQTPQAMLLGGASRVAGTSTTDHFRGFLGATDGTTFLCNAYSAEDAETTSRTIRSHKEKIAAAVRNAAGTPTTDAEADFTSFAADTFTIDWTTADATAREFSYLAFGTDSSYHIQPNRRAGLPEWPEPSQLDGRATRWGYQCTGETAPELQRGIRVSNLTAVNLPVQLLDGSVRRWGWTNSGATINPTIKQRRMLNAVKYTLPTPMLPGQQGQSVRRLTYRTGESAPLYLVYGQGRIRDRLRTPSPSGVAIGAIYTPS